MKSHSPQHLSAVVVGLVLGGGGDAALAAELPDLEMDVFRFELDNGLDVVVHEDHAAPLVAIQVTYGVGAADDVALGGHTGVAHLLEHLMFEGSLHAPGGSYDELLAATGATNNAWTDHDYTAYHMVAPAGALDLALFLESDRMGWLGEALSQESLDNQRSVVLNERGEDEDQPGGMLSDVIGASLFPAGHGYHASVLGTRDDLAGVQLQDVRRFHAAAYGPANATLVIVGDVDPTLAEERVRFWFSDVPSTARARDPSQADPMPLPAELRRARVDRVREASLYMVWPTVPSGHPDEPALDLLADVLGNDGASRLPQALVEGRLGAPEAEAWTSNDRLAGRFVIYASQGRHHLGRLLRRVDRVLAGLESDPPGEQELERQKARWKAWYIRASVGLEDKAAILSECAVQTGDPDCLQWDLERHMAVTVEDLQRVARTYLLTDGRLLLSWVPESRPGLALPGSEPVEPP